jgi:hypothetical protein
MQPQPRSRVLPVRGLNDEQSDKLSEMRIRIHMLPAVSRIHAGMRLLVDPLHPQSFVQ